MQPNLHDLDTVHLGEAYIANKLSIARNVGTTLNEALFNYGAVIWSDTGTERLEHNGVDHVEMNGVDTEEVVDLVITHFTKRGIPFHWIIGPLPQRDLEASLFAHGFVLDETEPAMAADVDIATISPHVSNLTIIPVTTSVQVGEWVQTWAFDAKRVEIDHWCSIYNELLYLLAENFTMYIAKIGDQPVGTVYVHYHAGVAAIHYLVTLPEFRCQGIGTALTIHAMQAARERGYHVAMLTASPYAVNIYRRLGFQEFGNVSTFLWRLP